jgi:hypothetical protein
MANPIIIIKDGSLVIDVDLVDEQCGPPQVTPSGGNHGRYRIKFGNTQYTHGPYASMEIPDPDDPNNKRAWKVQKWQPHRAG